MNQRDEWLVAEATASGRWYLLHAAKPVFLCEVFEAGERGGDESAVVSIGDYDLADFRWFSRRPPEPTVRRLIEDGVAVLTDYDESCQAPRRHEPTGARIRHYRQIASMTQEDLATEADLRQATISDIEAGRVDPQLSTLEAIAEALGVRLAKLVG